MHAVMEDLEKYWVITKLEEQIKDIKDLVVFVIMEYCGRLRVEEVSLLSLKVVFYFLEETRQHNTPHIMIMLKGEV